MTLEEYQNRSRLTARYPNIGYSPFDPILGLNVVSGEILGQLRQLMSRHGGAIDKDFKDAVAIKLGAALWHLAQIASELGLSLEEIAQASLVKGAK